MTGDDYHVVQQLNDPASNKRIQTLAMLLLLPMMVWFAAIMMITHGVFGQNWILSFVSGVAAASIILIVERSIIMSEGNRWTTAVRYALAFVLAMVGAFLIDEVLFAKDIDKRISQEAVTEIRTRYNDEVVAQDALMTKAKQIFDARQTEVNKEAEGTASGVKGAGPATAAKRETAMLAKVDYDNERAILSQLKSPERRAQLERDVDTAEKEVAENPNAYGLMYRMRTLFDLILEEPVLAAFWAFITGLFFLVEILPVTIKTGTKKAPTLYERWTAEHTVPRAFRQNGLDV